MESQKPGNSPGPGREVVERQRIAKERAAQKVCSWTVQNEVRGVLGRMTAGAAGWILDSGIKSFPKAASVASKTRRHSKRDEEAQVLH